MRIFQNQKQTQIQHRTILIAHRGYTYGHAGNDRRVPENTVSAFEYALQAGFGGVECDVWETGGTKPDLMILHDESLERMCGVKKNITDLSPEEIRSYPIQAKAALQILFRKQSSPKVVLFFREYLQIMAKKPDTVLFIEIKSKKPVSQEHAISDQAVRQLAKELSQICPEHKVIIQSFNLDSLINMKPYLKEGIELFYLTKKKKELTAEALWGYKKMGIKGISMKYTVAIPAVLKKIKACGLSTAVWTVDDQALAWDLSQVQQVEYIISNKNVLGKVFR